MAKVTARVTEAVYREFLAGTDLEDDMTARGIVPVLEVEGRRRVMVISWLEVEDAESIAEELVTRGADRFREDRAPVARAAIKQADAITDDIAARRKVGLL